MAGVMATALQEVGSWRPLLGWVSPSPEAWRDVQGRIGWGAGAGAIYQLAWRHVNILTTSILLGSLSGMQRSKSSA